MPEQNKNQTDDNYLIKLKKLNQSDELIAAKLSWTVNEVKERWTALQAVAEAAATNGYSDLAQHFNTFALQYQLLGQGLAQIGVALDKPYEPAELADLIRAGGKTPEQIASHILKNSIVLKKFVPLPPQQLFQMAQSG